MTQLVSELYDALRAAGISEEHAKAAASHVLGVEDKAQLATKADLAKLEADLTWRILGVLSLQTAIFAGIVAALKFAK